MLGVGRGDGGGGGLGQHSGLAQHGGPGGDGGLVRVPVNSIQGQDVFLNGEMNSSKYLSGYYFNNISADTDDTLPNLNLNGLTVGNAIIASAPTQPPEDSVKTNSHQKPDWLDNLTNNFESEIISECSKSTREAYQNNQSVFNPPSEWGNVRMEIKRMIVKKLKFIFNGSGRPVLPDVQKIVNVLKSGYPAFAESTKAGYKYGGSSGIDGFASQILTELYRTDGRSKARPRIKRKSGDDESAEEDESDDKLKPKKQRLVYGVDPKKFNAKKITNEASIAFKSLTNLNFEDREKIFSAHRSSLQAVLIQTPAAIPLTIPEFWSDSRHLESQFVYVTGSSEGLTKNIENRYASQIKIIEDVIKFKSEDGHVEEKIKEAEMKCAADYAGSELYKDIIVLRAASAQMGTTGKSESSFIRFWYEGEDNPEFSGPHLTAIYNGNMWGFELWVDKQPLIRNLDVVTAISAYLHLCFTLNLEYPAVSFYCNLLHLSVYIQEVFLAGSCFFHGHLAEESGLLRGHDGNEDRQEESHRPEKTE